MFAIPVIPPIAWKALTVVLAAVALFGGGAYWQRGRDAKAFAILTSEFAQYRGQAEGAARERTAANTRQAAADLMRKEHTDAEQVRRAAANRDRLRELRADTAANWRPAETPAGSVCPSGQTCFESDAFERARRELFEEIRRLADEGAAVEDALRVAREWAR